MPGQGALDRGTGCVGEALAPSAAFASCSAHPFRCRLVATMVLEQAADGVVVQLHTPGGAWREGRRRALGSAALIRCCRLRAVHVASWCSCTHLGGTSRPLQQS